MEQLKYKVVEGDNKKEPADVGDFVGSISSSESESGISSASSLESDSFQDVTSSISSLSSLADQLAATEPLNDMSSMFLQLPTKRGLSKYYQGKAQSFTSLANVRSLEDLVKPENPYNKKLKSCRSYEGVMGEIHRAKCTSERGLCSSLTLSAKRGSDNNIMGGRPPIPPHRSTTTISIPPNQAVLFV